MGRRTDVRFTLRLRREVPRGYEKAREIFGRTEEEKVVKDWDLPLLNQRTPNALLSTPLWVDYARQQLQSTLDFEARRRVVELRRSCGVEPELMSVRVNRPPRYGEADK